MLTPARDTRDTDNRTATVDSVARPFPPDQYASSKVTVDRNFVGILDGAKGWPVLCAHGNSTKLVYFAVFTVGRVTTASLQIGGAFRYLVEMYPCVPAGPAEAAWRRERGTHDAEHVLHSIDHWCGRNVLQMHILLSLVADVEECKRSNFEWLYLPLKTAKGFHGSIGSVQLEPRIIGDGATANQILVDFVSSKTDTMPDAADVMQKALTCHPVEAGAVLLSKLDAPKQKARA